MTFPDRPQCECCVFGRIRVFSLHSQTSVWCYCCYGTGWEEPTGREILKAFWKRFTTDYYKVPRK